MLRMQHNPKEVYSVQNYIVARVREARSRGDAVLSLGVGQICEEAGLEGEAKYVVCCEVLDSERFARSHALRYHHRTGEWGTEKANYTFLLGVGTKDVSTNRLSPSPLRMVRALLWMAIFACLAFVIWGVVTLVLG